MPCPHCKTVNTLCFWGPRSEARWKPPLLFVCSLALVGGFGWLLWHFRGRTDAELYLALTTFLVLMGCLGLLVSVHGCRACVARLTGEA